MNEDHQKRIESAFRAAHNRAAEARAKGYDPDISPESRQVNSLGGRVESLVGPTDIGPFIESLEEKSLPRHVIAARTVRHILKTHSAERVDTAYRCALAVVSRGVVTAPLDGLLKAHVTAPRNVRYLRLQFSSPIRSMPPAARALALLLGDVLRREMGLDAYVPDDDDLDRYLEEFAILSQEGFLEPVTKPHVLRGLIRACPVQVDGDPYFDMEVIKTRDLPKHPNNFVRPAPAILFVEGLASHISDMPGWLEELELDGWDMETDGKESSIKPFSSGPGGRIWLADPWGEEGFSKKTGLARNTGCGTVGMHPAAMKLLDGVAVPGAIVGMADHPGTFTLASVDGIRAPRVKLKDGTVKEIDPDDEKVLTMDSVEDMGEILVDGHPELSGMVPYLHRVPRCSLRHMSPDMHGLFPLSGTGGRHRGIKQALSGTIITELGVRKCPECSSTGFMPRCMSCGSFREHTGTTTSTKVDLDDMFFGAIHSLGMSRVPEVKGLDLMHSRDKTPEPLEKGILRAKHGLPVFKDGTVRMDMINLPLRAFTLKEIGIDLDRLRSLGYTQDISGEPLQYADQLVELMPQDVVLPRSAAADLLNVCRLVDDELELFYGMDPFFKAQKEEDLVGQLVVSLAPHGCTGIVGRIVGINDVRGLMAHPDFHGAKDRDCDGDEDALILLMDVLLNFSRSYLPSFRGGRMDVPILLITRINNERAARWDTDTSNISRGPNRSTLEDLPNLWDRWEVELSLAKKLGFGKLDELSRDVIIRETGDLWERLREFGSQNVQCSRCGATARRMPISGHCRRCNGIMNLCIKPEVINSHLEHLLSLCSASDPDGHLSGTVDIIRSVHDSMFKNDIYRKSTLDEFGEERE